MASFTSGYRAFTPTPSNEGDPIAHIVSPRSFRVLPVPSDSPVMHRFVVTVETGDRKWAGTDEEVRIQLFGDRGSTSEILLGENDDMKTSLRYVTPRTPDENTRYVFAQGSVREFSFMATFVGNLVKTRVRHDGGNNYGKAWRLERIVVRDEQLQRSWSFACQKWLTHDQGNEIELVPSGDVAAGRRASIRASRRRSGYIHRDAFGDTKPVSVVAEMRNKYSNEDVSVPTSSSTSSDGGVRRVCFQLTKNDNVGHMYLFGAIPALGQWDTSRALRMVMHTGADGTWRGEWRLELEVDDDFDVVEYKYLQVDESNDKVHLSDEARVLKLSDAIDSSSRKVEGGVIYVRDSFGGDSSKTPFCTMAPGTSSCPPLEPSAHRKAPGVADTDNDDSPRPTPTPSPSYKRNSLGFMSKGGSAFLVAEADSDFITPGTSDAQVVAGTTFVPAFGLESDCTGAIGGSGSDIRGSHRRISSSSSDGTAKLKSELEVTRHLLSESKMEMMKKDAELAILNEKLNFAQLTEFSAALRDGSIAEVHRAEERSSPVPSEFGQEHEISDLSIQNEENSASLGEDSKSETPEGTDSDSAPESRTLPTLNAIPILPTRRSVESQLLTPRSTPRSPSLRETPSQRDYSPALSTPPVSAQRRYAQRLVSAQKVRKAAACVQRELDDLRQDLKDLHEVMTGQCEKYEARQAELVRLMMDASEVRIAEKNSLLAERDVLHSNWIREFKERRNLFNIVQELKGNIRVFCRVRPLKEPRDKNGSPATTAVSFPNVSLGDANCIQVCSKNFDFARVFGPETSQEKVYDETSGVIGSVLDGYNVCVFAYGQTGSGKTHTMNGLENDRGVNFRALADLFKLASERSELGSVRVVVSMIEIYNDTLKDLIFEPAEGNETPPKLDIRKDVNAESKTAVYIPNLTEVEVASVEDVWEVMEKGSHNRAMEATSMNEHSSRSHLILRVGVEIDNKRSGAKTSGVLSLVDLAGSERVGRSQAAGDRLREAQHINKSLATLGDVFTALLTKSPHVPYRNSKLTYLLQDSLGGDSKTLMFVNVSCDQADANETMSSLQFAQRVSKVELGSAKRHSESLAANKMVVSLNEKQTENDTLKSQLVDLQRDMKKRDKLLEEHKQKLRIVEKDLKESNRAIEEKKKRDATDRGGAIKELRELKAVDEKRQTEMRNTKLKMREVTKAKDDDIRRLRHQIEDRDKRIAALEKMEMRSRSASKSSAASFSVSESQSAASAPKPGRPKLPREGVMTSSAASSLSTSDTASTASRTSGGRPRLLRGATVSGSIEPRPKSVRFEVPDDQTEKATESETEAASLQANEIVSGEPELGPAHRRASSRLDVGLPHRRAIPPSSTVAENGVSHRRATVAGANETGSEVGSAHPAHRRASSKIGEARRVSSMSSIPRAPTTVGPPSRFNRPSSVPAVGGKRASYVPGNSASTPSTTGRPARPPRSSTMRKPPLRNVGLAARNANGASTPRANTFSSSSGAGRNTAIRAASKAESKPSFSNS